MTAEHDLWHSVLLTYFDDMKSLPGKPLANRKRHITRLLYTALSPWTKHICFVVGMDHAAFYKGLATCAREVSKLS